MVFSLFSLLYNPSAREHRRFHIRRTFFPSNFTHSRLTSQLPCRGAVLSVENAVRIEFQSKLIGIIEDDYSLPRSKVKSHGGHTTVSVPLSRSWSIWFLLSFGATLSSILSDCEFHAGEYSIDPKNFALARSNLTFYSIGVFISGEELYGKTTDATAFLPWSCSLPRTLYPA